MNIYGITKATIVWADNDIVEFWTIVKIVRCGDQLVWRELYTEELQENGWLKPWNEYTEAGASLEVFRKTFNFPYVGENFHDVRRGEPYPCLPVDPAHFYSGEDIC